MFLIGLTSVPVIRHGRINDLLVGLMGLIIGARTLYYAYKGLWVPGGIGSRREPIAAAWYHRAFLVLGGVFGLYLGYLYLSSAFLEWRQ